MSWFFQWFKKDQNLIESPTAFVEGSIDNSWIAEDVKKAYSDGFEHIYKLEEVDGRTLRPLKMGLDEEIEKTIEKPTKDTSDIPTSFCQSEVFETGSGLLPSLALQLPIHILGLSTHTEKRLTDLGKKKVYELVQLITENPDQKGVNHAHLDEIRDCLFKLFPHFPDIRISVFENETFWTCLFSEHDPKSSYLFLESYQQQSAISLTPLQQADIRRQYALNKKACFESCRQLIHSTTKKQWIRDYFKVVVENFVIPWICSKGGFALQSEINEWIEYHAQNPRILPGFYDVISKEAGMSGFLWGEGLFNIPGTQVMAISKTEAEKLTNLWRKLDEFFYKAGVIISFHKILDYLQNEFKILSPSLDEKDCKRFIRLSGRYRIFTQYEPQQSYQVVQRLFDYT